MKNSICETQSLGEIEMNIVKEVHKCEFWGDLELSSEELDILKDKLRNEFSTSGTSVYFICKSFPHSITTYMVFFVRYKYNVNFWGVISEELGIELPEHLQGELGRCAKKMFMKYNMDYSETKDETKRRIAPIMYEACLPPESSLDDLFYVLSHDSYRIFDPQIIIEELLEKRAFSIRKPMERFLKRFKDDRAIDFLLEIRDAMLAVDQRNVNTSRFIGNYVEWKEEEKTKAVIHKGQNLEFQAKPYLYFDNGNKGLCLVLPYLVMESEWIEEVQWTIEGNNGFYREITGLVLGDEGKRYTDVLVIPVSPSEKYTVSVVDSERIDDKGKREWVVEGIKKDKVVFFTTNGRQVNANYLLSPYGIMIASNKVNIIEATSIDLTEQSYPTSTEEYRIISVTPLGNDANFRYVSNGNEYSIGSRPQINISFEGKTLFSLPESTNIFTKIPSLIITTEGAVVTDGMELRIGGKNIPIDLLPNDDTYFNLEEIARKEIRGSGTYSVRLYRFGRFLKQAEFYIVPSMKTNYNPFIFWPSISNRKEKLTYKFQRIDDWEIDFEGCSVGSDDEYYHVTIPSNFGSLIVTVKSLQSSFKFERKLELPIRAFEAELVDVDGNTLENITDRTLKIGLNSILETEKWLSFRTFGNYKDKSYQLRIKTVNGVEQSERIRLSQKGSGNINLASFYETLRNCPIPAELELVCDEDEEKALPLLLISEKLEMEKRVTYKRQGERAFISLQIEDDGKDIFVTRFGFNCKEYPIPYSKSLLGKHKNSRGYPFPGELIDGIYIISASKEQKVFEFEEDESVELSIGNNIMLVDDGENGTKSSDIKNWLRSFVKAILNSEIKKSYSDINIYNELIKEEYILKLEKCCFDDNDVEYLVALGCFANSKIAKEKKEQISKCMRLISENFMHRGDRFRIIELLIELDVSQEIFDICFKEYSLLLVYSDNKNAKELAGKVEKYSVELSMVLMMSTDGSIRDCIWREKFRDLIGKDSIRKLLSVPKEKDAVIIAEEQKKFLREISGSRVRINLDDEISGNEKITQGMIGFDKKGNPFFDITKKSDYGIYFCGIKYVDQYVNWFKSVHDREMKLEPKLEGQMISVVKDNYEEINDCIDYLKKDAKICNITKQYVEVISERYHQGTSIVSYSLKCYPRYFYYQGLAAFLAKLPVDRERLDDFRSVGIKFMSTAYIISPKLAQRDILMATTYIYLKRKEEKLCR